MELTVTQKQRLFLEADATEVLFGGAAGGGKSYGQLIDALLYALRYPGSRQLILRRTYPELEKSLIRTSRALFPGDIYTYHAGNHCGRFCNGSLIDFGYCADENDVYQYQSAEYDTIRFDELTHFTEFQYLYLVSRLRGANPYPKRIKSSTNPGGVGHRWVKARFIDPVPPGETFAAPDGTTRLFLPARLEDNCFLMAADPGYRQRLEVLPEAQKRALLLGDWHLFEGQYFGEFSYQTHTCEPFDIPAGWRRYRTVDYGLDRLACLWVALDSTGRAYVYRELCASNYMISQASEAILSLTPPEERIYATLAPPDLWHRSQESGRSKALLFAEHGLDFTKTANDRETGWLAIKEWLRPDRDGYPRLQIFRCCTELIKCLPMLQYDPARPTDTLITPHEITHAPDALRGFAIYFSRPAEEAVPEKPLSLYSPDLLADYEAASESERAYLRRRYGLPKSF
ncbi:MAG: terminase family protein [Eubacteriales bacterium]